MALQYSRNQLLSLRNCSKCSRPGLQTVRHCYSTVTRQWTRPVLPLVWHSLKRLGILRRMRGRRGGQRLNNHRIKPIESAYRALGTNSNFMRDYSKNSVATSNVRLGPPSAACLLSFKSSTGRVIDQLNQDRKSVV